MAPIDPVLVEAAAILRQSTLAQAGRIARDGDLQGAEDLIRPLLKAGPPDVAGLDLLARIRAQRGAWSEAEALWSEALRLAPDHAGAQAGLAGVRRRHALPAWTAPARWLAGGVGAALILVLAGWSGWGWHLRQLAAARADLAATIAAERTQADRRVASAEARWEELHQSVERSTDVVERMGHLQVEMAARLSVLSDSSRALSAQLEIVQEARRDLTARGEVLARQAEAADLRTAERLRELEKLISAASAVPAPAANPAAVEAKAVRPPLLPFTIPGAETLSRSGGIEVRFPNGLFRSGTRWSEGAQAMLSALADQLAARDSPCTVEIAGTAGRIAVVYPWTRHRTPAALALARAMSVADLLRRLGLPEGCRLRVTNDPSLVWPGAGASDPRSVVVRLSTSP